MRSQSTPDHSRASGAQSIEDFVSLRGEVLRLRLPEPTTTHFMETIGAAEHRRDPVGRRRAILDILRALAPYRGGAA